MSRTSDSYAELRPPAAQLLGRELVASDSSNAEIHFQFHARAEFANRHGNVQGGLLAAMLDSATASALSTVLPSGRTALTTELKVSFLHPAPLGSIFAVARILDRDDRTAQTTAELRDHDGNVVARGTASFRIVARR